MGPYKTMVKYWTPASLNGLIIRKLNKITTLLPFFFFFKARIKMEGLEGTHLHHHHPLVDLVSVFHPTSDTLQCRLPYTLHTSFGLAAVERMRSVQE